MANEFMNELDRAMADLDSAMEGMFCNPETTVEILLNKVRESLKTKVTTVEAADELSAKLDSEVVAINKNLTDISSAMAQVRNGTLSKDAAKEIIIPAVTAIKGKCTALGLNSELSPENDICPKEVEMLREFVVGCKTVIDEHRAALAGEEGSDQAGKAATLVHGAPATESDEELVKSFEAMIGCNINDEAALEALFGPNIRSEILKGTEMKTANAMYKQAKALRRAGSNEKAIATMQKAKTLYEKLVTKARKLSRTKTQSRTDSERAYYSLGASIASSTTREEKVYTGGIGSVLEYLWDRIDSCQAYILKWQNKDSSKDFKALKAELKAEKKAERARIKEETKAAKAANKEQRAADKAARKEAKAAEKAAKKAAKAGDTAGAVEALIAMVQYATEGKMEYEEDDFDAMAMEASIEMDVAFESDTGDADDLEDLDL